MRSPIKKNSPKIIPILVIIVAFVVFARSPSSSSIPSHGSVYYSPAAKALILDEFESGDFSAWNGTFTTVGDNATVVATNPWDGVYHGHFRTNALPSGVKYAYCCKVLSPRVSEVYARGYFYIVDGLPLDDNDDRFGLIGFEVGGHLQCTFRVYRSGHVDRFNIVGRNGSSSASKSTDAIYPVEGKWYCLEFYIKVHSSMGAYRAWINGVEQIAITNIDSARHGSGVSRVRFGLTYTANVQHSVQVYCDSVAMTTRYIGRASYIVYTDGTLFNMKNCSSGQKDWHSTDASAVLKACKGNLTGGGTIVVKRGTYTLHEPFDLGDNICVFGEGKQSYLKMGTPNEHVILVASKSNVSIENLGIEGYDDGIADGIFITGSCDDVVVRNCWVTMARYGIQVYETSLTTVRTLLEGNYLVNNVVGEIYVRYARSVTVRNNYCENNVNADFGVVNAYCEKNVVHGNVVDGLKGFGIQMYFSNEITVSDNIIRNIGGNVAYDQTGITVDNCTWNVIVNNQVTNVTKHGIYLEDSNYCIVKANAVTESGDYGIQLYSACTSNLIDSNTVMTSGKGGILVNSGDNNTIQGNLVLNNGQAQGGGILLYNGVTGTLILDNYVTDNQTLKTQEFGIKEQMNCDYNHILSNYVEGNAVSAIIVIGANTIVESNIGF